MRRAIYTAIFCSLLAVVTWASSDTWASAGRAWMLRTEAQSRTSAQGKWRSMSFDGNVHETRWACEEALLRSMKRRVQVRKEASVKVLSPREVDALGFDDRALHFITMSIPAHRISEVFQGQRDGSGLIFYQYSCLPVTVDPRGPKRR